VDDVLLSDRAFALCSTRVEGGHGPCAAWRPLLDSRAALRTPLCVVAESDDDGRTERRLIAFVPCRRCGKQVSTSVISCPYCAAPLPSELTSATRPPAITGPSLSPESASAAGVRRPPSKPIRKWEEILWLRTLLLALDLINGLILLFAFFPLFILFGLLGIAAALVARSKGRDTIWWFLYGFAIWYVALPHALLMKPDVAGMEGRQIGEGQRKCPFCAEMIKAEARVCRFCGRDLPDTVDPRGPKGK
jgi:hypothetical protein